jgi:hypothetical protein
VEYEEVIRFVFVHGALFYNAVRRRPYCKSRGEQNGEVAAAAGGMAPCCGGATARGVNKQCHLG